MIEVRHPQRTFGEGLIHEAVQDLWEPWMRHADQALEDEALLLLIQQELMKRCKKSKTRGRKATPVEVVLRMMLLKHVRNWSFEVLSREVRANLVIETSLASARKKFPTRRPWETWHVNCHRNWSTSSTSGWSGSLWKTKSSPVKRCEWIPQWSRRISTIPLTVA